MAPSHEAVRHPARRGSPRLGGRQSDVQWRHQETPAGQLERQPGIAEPGEAAQIVAEHSRSDSRSGADTGASPRTAVPGTTPAAVPQPRHGLCVASAPAGGGGGRCQDTRPLRLPALRSALVDQAESRPVSR